MHEFRLSTVPMSVNFAPDSLLFFVILLGLQRGSLLDAGSLSSVFTSVSVEEGNGLWSINEKVEST